MSHKSETIQTADSITTIVSRDEPGETLILQGRVADAAGKPIDSVRVYLYHTDAKGIYSIEGSRNPRIKANLFTDTAGMFRFKTIWPGSYPASKNPRHIHFVLNKSGRPEKEIEVVFENDPLLTEDFKKRPGIMTISLDKDSRGQLSGKIEFVIN